MALPTVYSCVSAVALAVLTFAAMQVFRDELSAEGGMTILGGFIGSWFFVFLLTAVGNAGTLLFGGHYQTKLFPDALACVAASVFISGLVHRVSASTCLIFSLLALFFLQRLSHATYDTSSQATPTPGKPQAAKPNLAKTSATPSSPRSKKARSK